MRARNFQFSIENSQFSISPPTGGGRATVARVGVTAIAPNEPCPRRIEFAEGFIEEAEEVAEARSIIANAPKPARPCPLKDGQLWIVRYATKAIRFEIQGGKNVAITCSDEEASLFKEMDAARILALDAFGTHNDVTIEPYTPPPPA